MHQLDAIWGSADQYTCLFYENSQKRRLVNLSEIINEAAALIDCGSDGERKSGGPDIKNLPSTFHLSLSYQFRLFQQTPFDAFFSPRISQRCNEISVMNVGRTKYNILCIICAIHHCELMHVFLLLEVKWDKESKTIYAEHLLFPITGVCECVRAFREITEGNHYLQLFEIIWFSRLLRSREVFVAFSLAPLPVVIFYTPHTAD